VMIAGDDREKIGGLERVGKKRKKAELVEKGVGNLKKNQKKGRGKVKNNWGGVLQ